MLVACGGGGGQSGYQGPPPPVQTYTVGGSASGLSGTVVLQDNRGDNLSVGANGIFTFAKSVAAGGSYSVTVLTQPADQTCTVASGTGMVSANVSSVAVTCTMNHYTIGGTASGLVRPVVLQNNLGGNLTVGANGTFVFAGTVAAGGSYSVTVLTVPAPFSFPTSSNLASLSLLGSGISIGMVGNLSQNQSVGLVYDSNSHIIVSLSVPNTDVVWVSPGN
jgi:hypothetical protein